MGEHTTEQPATNYWFLGVLAVDLAIWWAVLAIALGVHAANVAATGFGCVAAAIVSLYELSAWITGRMERETVGTAVRSERIDRPPRS